MAKCRSCGTAVPDGAKYCEECMSKLNTAEDSESYLDSLLSAVMTDEPERREIVYPKREASSLRSVSENKEPVKGEASADVMQQPAGAQDEPKQSEEVPEEAPLEDVFGTFFHADTELPDLKTYDIFKNVDEHSVDRLLAADLGDAYLWDSEGEAAASGAGDIADGFGMSEDERGADAPKDIEESKETEELSAVEFDEVSDILDGAGKMPEEETVDGEVSAADFGDFADLFCGGEPETSAEVKAEEEIPMTDFGDFADIFGGNAESEPTAPEGEAVPASEFGDMSDLFGDMFDFGAEPEVLDEEPANIAENASVAAAMLAGEELAAKEAGQKEKKGAKKEKGKGKGRLAALYHKLFDNVKVDPSKIKPQPTKEELEARKKEREEAKARSKEEKEALLAEKREQERQVKLEKQRVVKEAKAEKKARKLEEAKLLLEEMEGTRINRAGASIVFLFFAMIAVVIVAGTSIFSYAFSIRNAEYEFDRDEYTLAYNEIYGLDIKDEDIVLYDRIMTVMYVQKQLNSYYNYYGMNDKPRALDSLLKGLQRYEKYIELAVKLDVDSDLDTVRKKILAEINASFLLTEQEAMEIIQSDSQVEYSKKVYDAVEGLE